MTVPELGTTPVAIFGFAVAADNGGATGGGSAGKVTFTAVQISKLVGPLSAPLLGATATGRAFPAVEIELFVPGGTAVQAEYRLNEVLIKAVSSSGMESVTLEFSRIAFTTEGSTFCWDVKRNKSC